MFKTTSNEYTQYMMAGAEKAAAETGAVLDMKGATSETAYDEQQNMIETDLHANKYDAMIIAPLQGDMASTLVSGTDMPIFAIDMSQWAYGGKTTMDLDHTESIYTWYRLSSVSFIPTKACFKAFSTGIWIIIDGSMSFISTSLATWNCELWL